MKIDKQTLTDSLKKIEEHFRETVWECPCCDKQLGIHEDGCELYILGTFIRDLEGN